MQKNNDVFYPFSFINLSCGFYHSYSAGGVLEDSSGGVTGATDSLGWLSGGTLLDSLS